MSIVLEAHRRQRICKDCVELKPTMIGWKCSECGCYVKAKSMIPTSKCPLGKWELDND